MQNTDRTRAPLLMHMFIDLHNLVPRESIVDRIEQHNVFSNLSIITVIRALRHANVGAYLERELTGRGGLRRGQVTGLSRRAHDLGTPRLTSRGCTGWIHLCCKIRGRF